MPGLPRIDVLLHELPREFLEAAIHLALDERRGQLEGNPLRQLPEQVGAQLRAARCRRASSSRSARIRSRSAASDSNSPRSLANSSSRSGSTRRRMSFDRDGRRSARCWPAPGTG